MTLSSGCHLVASGFLGFSLSSQWDCNSYLLMSQESAVLIDAGCGREVPDTARRIDALLGSSTSLVGILLTHSHLDHAGGAAALSNLYQVPVFAHPIAVSRLAASDEEAIGLVSARNAGVYPSDIAFEGLRGAVPLHEGQVPLDDFSIDVVHTPGHSEDHIAYMVDLPAGRALFSGDLIFGQGLVAYSGVDDSSFSCYQASLRKVLQLHPSLLFPGHGAFSLRDGWRHVDAAVRKLDEGNIPPNFVAQE